MITSYHRPKTLEQVMALISRPIPQTIPLGGGTFLSRPHSKSIEVVDLQDLGLNKIKLSGNNLEIGATTTLQQLIENDQFPTSLKLGLKLEAPLNIRNVATIAGTLVMSDGRSTFATMMLALDAKIILQPDDQEILIGNLLPLRETILRGKLITRIVVPVNVKITFEYISLTPADKPLACVALSRWSSGRTRLVVGGYGNAPILAMDGTESSGLESAARNSFNDANDEWVSAEYRRDVVATLVRRSLLSLEQI